jgi:hypothetical protein
MSDSRQAHASELVTARASYALALRRAICEAENLSLVADDARDAGVSNAEALMQLGNAQSPVLDQLLGAIRATQRPAA